MPLEYEVYEPPMDEYYDAACKAAYAAMFNGGMACGSH